jgi:hypothetical protein
MDTFIAGAVEFIVAVLAGALLVWLGWPSKQSLD